MNRRFLKIHETKGPGITHKMPNPFAPDQRDVYFVSDPPHLIKTVRNSWASKKRNLWVWLVAEMNTNHTFNSATANQLTGGISEACTKMAQERTE